MDELPRTFAPNRIEESNVLYLSGKSEASRSNQQGPCVPRVSTGRPSKGSLKKSDATSTSSIKFEKSEQSARFVGVASIGLANELGGRLPEGAAEFETCGTSPTTQGQAELTGGEQMIGVLAPLQSQNLKRGDPTTLLEELERPGAPPTLPQWNLAGDPGDPRHPQGLVRQEHSSSFTERQAFLPPPFPMDILSSHQPPPAPPSLIRVSSSKNFSAISTLHSIPEQSTPCQADQQQRLQIQPAMLNGSIIGAWAEKTRHAKIAGPAGTRTQVGSPEDSPRASASPDSRRRSMDDHILSSSPYPALKQNSERVLPATQRPAVQSVNASSWPDGIQVDRAWVPRVSIGGSQMQREASKNLDNCENGRGSAPGGPTGFDAGSRAGSGALGPPCSPRSMGFDSESRAGSGLLCQLYSASSTGLDSSSRAGSGFLPYSPASTGIEPASRTGSGALGQPYSPASSGGKPPRPPMKSPFANPLGTAALGTTTVPQEGAMVPQAYEESPWQLKSPFSSSNVQMTPLFDDDSSRDNSGGTGDAARTASGTVRAGSGALRTSSGTVHTASGTVQALCGTLERAGSGAVKTVSPCEGPAPPESQTICRPEACLAQAISSRSGSLPSQLTPRCSIIARSSSLGNRQGSNAVLTLGDHSSCSVATQEGEPGRAPPTALGTEGTPGYHAVSSRGPGYQAPAPETRMSPFTLGTNPGPPDMQYLEWQQQQLIQAQGQMLTVPTIRHGPQHAIGECLLPPPEQRQIRRVMSCQQFNMPQQGPPVSRAMPMGFPAHGLAPQGTRGPGVILHHSPPRAAAPNIVGPLGRPCGVLPDVPRVPNPDGRRRSPGAPKHRSWPQCRRYADLPRAPKRRSWPQYRRYTDLPRASKHRSWPQYRRYADLRGPDAGDRLVRVPQRSRGTRQRQRPPAADNVAP
eukprot:jgi/Botrbrau1/23100/Bobra.0243s0037.1